MATFGPLGGALSDLNSADPATAAATARELERLGYSTLWLAGRQENNLPQIANVVRATSRIGVASGILSVDVVGAAEVTAAYTALEQTNPGRFLVGLGGAHGPKPLATLNAYLDEVEPVVPRSRRILSALGPRMLELARDRAAGAYPYLVTPDYVAAARQILGDGARLAVLVDVITETDPARAHESARGGGMRFLTGLPTYAGNLRRMGFGADDISALSDRLLDGVTIWGDLDAIVRRIGEYRTAGADQVVVQLGRLSREWWARLAEAVS
ncbi:MAG TPA: TIGR03620 family F420-dependent LLM class oxidoreductase [Pseudonocardia sp.]|uniref:TIGR03620 family F420-dependent LLM class oxidoreductase n=1 Tax=Pseudonocardia sp. TaxID=60912 RepID=UPI002B4ABC93|nr:TIGR03620 family F420-dependent LLM class oxidoreductase [Pseudonocardia sp.]HLU55941.1 TIGR03620 family F420-dependent LLM class oxidoreductase [Pseudonocardia sp.]